MIDIGKGKSYATSVYRDELPTITKTRAKELHWFITNRGGLIREHELLRCQGCEPLPSSCLHASIARGSARWLAAPSQSMSWRPYSGAVCARLGATGETALSGSRSLSLEEMILILVMFGARE